MISAKKAKRMSKECWNKDSYEYETKKKVNKAIKIAAKLGYTRTYIDLDWDDLDDRKIISLLEDRGYCVAKYRNYIADVQW